MPITGYDIKERENTAKELAEYLSTKYVCDVVTPFSASPYDPTRSWEECMRLCIIEMLQCSDVFVADGWEKSRGCSIEVFMSANCGLNIHYL